MIEREEELISIIESCPEIMETLKACKQYGLRNFYLAGGAITQLLWNTLLKKSQLGKIKDFDIVYFSRDEEIGFSKVHKSKIEKLVTHKLELDIVNQAYVHEWYGDKFGNKIDPFTRTEDGIKTWLPAFAIGVTIKEKIEIYAPYGLNDAFNMLVRPNKLTMSEDNYLKMTRSFKSRWDQIEVLAWNENDREYKETTSNTR